MSDREEEEFSSADDEEGFGGRLGVLLGAERVGLGGEGHAHTHAHTHAHAHARAHAHAAQRTAR